MSLDERIRTGLGAWGDSLDVDLDQVGPNVRKRGRRRAIKNATLVMVLVATVGVGSAVGVNLVKPTRSIAPSSAGQLAKREPADREFQRSYGVRFRWKVASGRTSGARWVAWAFEPEPGKPCLAVDGHSSCFAGFGEGGAVEYGSGGEEPPIGGVFDILGYAKLSVTTVRIDIVGRAPVFVPTVAVAGWKVRSFAVVLPGRLGEITIKSVTGLDSRGQVVDVPATPPDSQSAAIDGLIVTYEPDSKPVADATIVIDEPYFETTSDALGRFVFRRIPLAYDCTMVTIRVRAAGFAEWTVIDNPLHRGQGHLLEVTLSKKTPSRETVGPPRTGGEQCRRNDGTRVGIGRS